MNFEHEDTSEKKHNIYVKSKNNMADKSPFSASAQITLRETMKRLENCQALVTSPDMKSNKDSSSLKDLLKIKMMNTEKKTREEEPMPYDSCRTSV